MEDYFNLNTLNTLIAVATTVFFINDKISKGVRVIAFGESESEKSAIYSFIMMCIIIISWTIYLLKN